MRFAAFRQDGLRGLAVAVGSAGYVGLTSNDAAYPGDLDDLIAKGDGALASAHRALSAGRPIDLGTVSLLPPLSNPGKII
ncbi:hypothetical protein, partial [Enterobacter hormaechei]|uniref:hypothetical protein n=1 Tax=Enterobacter hormaechei TaxID=158836 RepID=UPI00195354D6